MNQIEKAKMLSDILHSNQKYDEFDYNKHLDDVVNVLKKFNIDDEAIIVACYLHDTVEDTQMKISKVREYFGDEVADIVFAVTNELGENRKERNLKTYQKLIRIPKAIKLKLGDRIANTEHSLNKGNMRFFEMYRNEYPGFRTSLFNDKDNLAMWDYLDNLYNYTK